MKFAFIVVVALFCSGLQASVATCSDRVINKSRVSSEFISANTLELLDSVLVTESAQGVAPIHQTQAYLVRNSSNVPIKTPVSVVVYHGLLNSPAWMKWMAESAHQMGLNVINVRLPKHFTAERMELDKVDHREFMQLTETIRPIAEGLSQSGKIVYIGHSTGALMSILTTVNHLDSTAGMILFSPALGINERVRRTSNFLSRLGISGWLLDYFSRNDSIDNMNRYLSTHSAVQVDLLAKMAANAPGEGTDAPDKFGLVIQRLQDVPMVWIDTESDKIISLQRNREVSSLLKSTQRFVFPRVLRVDHNRSIEEPGSAKTLAEAEAKTESTRQSQNFLLGFLR